MTAILRRFAVLVAIAGCQQSQPPAKPVSPVIEQTTTNNSPSVVNTDDTKPSTVPVVNENPLPQPPKNDAPASIPVAAEKTKAEKEIAAAWDRRRAEWNAFVTDISVAKSSLKQALISDDTESIAKHRKTIEELQTELRRLLDAPLLVSSFDPEVFEVGQVGRLDGVSAVVPFGAQQVIKVFQVLKKSDVGDVLVRTTYQLGQAAEMFRNGQRRMGKKLDRAYEPVLFKVVGIDTTTLIDGGPFPLSLPPMVVTGTYSYETVSGGSKTIFELHSVDARSPFTNENDLKDVIAAAASDYAISLTEDEKAQSDAARQKHATELAQKQKLAMDEKSQQQAELKARRSKSCLENGKILLKKDNFAGARKQFEKAIAEDPDSESAKEAAELIEKLP